MGQEELFNPTTLLAQPVGERLEKFTQVEGIDEQLMDALGELFQKLNANNDSYVADDIAEGWSKIDEEKKKTLREHFSDAEIFAMGVMIIKVDAMAKRFITEQLMRGLIGKLGGKPAID